MLVVFRILCLAFVFAVGLNSVIPSQVLAQDAELSQLRQRVFEMEEKMKALQEQLKECQEARKNQQSAESGWQNKKNWRSLKVGMEEEQVRSILGDPVKVIKGVKTLWYYPNFYGSYVSFNENGRLSGWNEP